MFLLPAVAFIGLYMNLYCRKQEVIRALANSCIIMTLYIWAVAEFFSVFNMWTGTVVGLLWVGFILGNLWIFIKNKYYVTLKESTHKNSKLVIFGTNYPKWLVVMGIYFIFILVTTILNSQNTADALIYHLPRIMHWIQNKSVGYYATNTSLQVKYSALAEYIVAQIYILGGSDQLANMVQAGSYMCSAILIFGITRKLGVSGKLSFVSSWIYLLTPMALVQSYTTQTDDIAGMFLLVYIFFILDFIQADVLRKGKSGIVEGMRLAACVVLGYLCKPTICFTMVAFFVWMCIVRLIKKDRFCVLFKYIIVGGITAIILYLPLFMKTYQTYIVETEASVKEAETGEEEWNSLGRGYKMSSPVDTIAPDSASVINAVKSPRIFVATCMMNMGRNMSSNSFPLWNEFIVRVINKAGKLLNYDVSKFAIQREGAFWQVGTASNPSMMLFWLIAVVCIVFRISKTQKDQTIYMICASMGILAQCGMMGFTLYRGRYLVGAMAVLCPAVAAAIDKFRVKFREYIVIAMFIIMGVGFINTISYQVDLMKFCLGGQTDIHKYFSDNYREDTHTRLVQYINENGFKQIGIENIFDYEYVLWKGIDQIERMESVNVQVSALRKYEDMSFIPECIIEESEEQKETDKLDQVLVCHGVSYRCVWTVYGNAHHYSVYVPE